MNMHKTIKIISNPLRLAILQWLADPQKHFAEFYQEGAIESEEKSVCVGLIQRKSGLSQSATSQYLSQLEDVGLVKSTRRGNWIHYSRDEEGIKTFLAKLNEILKL